MHPSLALARFTAVSVSSGDHVCWSTFLRPSFHVNPCGAEQYQDCHEVTKDRKRLYGVLESHNEETKNFLHAATKSTQAVLKLHVWRTVVIWKRLTSIVLYKPSQAINALFWAQLELLQTTAKLPVHADSWSCWRTKKRVNTSKDVKRCQPQLCQGFLQHVHLSPGILLLPS